MGDTPLHYSSAKGNVIITSLLLDYGASINAQNEVILILSILFD